MSREHNLLLEWVSERGTGTWNVFRQAHDWLLNKGRPDESRIPAHRTATTMAVMGQIEIDWLRRQWSAAPPILTVLPAAGAHALLSGGRTRTLLSTLEAETSPEVTQDVMYFHYEQPDAADVVHLAAQDETGILSLAKRLDIGYEFCVADRISKLLPTLDRYLSASISTPGVRQFEIEKWNAQDFQWTQVLTDGEPGFYRYGVYGGYEYRFVDPAGQFHALDLATGVYAELKRVGKRVLKYRSESVNGRLIAPWGVPLPILHARAAALCSGLAPRNIERARHYVNVPREIADRIARSLAQEPLFT